MTKIKHRTMSEIAGDVRKAYDSAKAGNGKRVNEENASVETPAINNEAERKPS